MVALLKFFLLVYCLVLVVDVFLMLYLRDLGSDIRKALYGGHQPLMPRKRAEKRWRSIMVRLESGSVSQYKAAILEADAFVSEVLSSMGKKGTTMQEQLTVIGGAEIASKEILLSAHEMRNRIIHETDLELTREEAAQWLGEYHKFLREVGLLNSK